MNTLVGIASWFALSIVWLTAILAPYWMGTKYEYTAMRVSFKIFDAILTTILAGRCLGWW